MVSSDFQKCYINNLGTFPGGGGSYCEPAYSGFRGKPRDKWTGMVVVGMPPSGRKPIKVNY